MSWLGIEGKVAIVTGGAAGIGRACCNRLAAAGVSVVVADVNGEAGAAVVEELESAAGGGHLFVEVNVADRGGVEKMTGEVMDELGRIDILVNNAGILIPRLLVDPAGEEELTEEILDRMISINQKGCFFCAQAVAREMIRSGEGGVIVNMSSESGLEGSEGQSVYAATKGAIYSMTRSWAKELGKYRIRVAGLAPGIVEATDLRSEEYERALAYTRGVTVQEVRASYEKVSIPLGRSGKLSEVADAVCFLVSDRAAYIHGTTLNVSGGKSRG